MADIFDSYSMSAAWDEMFVKPGVPRPPYESVFATLSGWLVLGEMLSLREGIGAAVMLCAALLAQL